MRWKSPGKQEQDVIRLSNLEKYLSVQCVYLRLAGREGKSNHFVKPEIECYEVGAGPALTGSEVLVGAGMGPRVLLIEDNPGDVRLLKEYVAASPISFQVADVPSLEQAKIRLQEENVDLIIADLSLPDSRGTATFRELRESAPLVPIIVLSGYEDESLAEETVRDGAQDYLMKDEINDRTLLRAMRYALKRVEADRMMQQERSLLRAVIDNLPDSIYVKDVHGRFLLDNVAHMQGLGVSSMDQVVGKTAFDFFPADIAMKFDSDDHHVVETGDPIVRRHEKWREDEQGVKWVSTTKVPLRNPDGKIIGLVGIGRDITKRKRAEEQLALYTRELCLKNTQMEDDLKMARELQQAFLPHQFPTFPRQASVGQSALRFCSQYIPTTEVGGDFFHVQPISDTMAGVFICDVMGHGVRAALVTAIQRTLVEELSAAAADPGKFLTQINRSLIAILKRTHTPTLVSAFYLVMDVATGEMAYASAGHPTPLHIQRDAGLVEALGEGSLRPGPALGVFEGWNYDTHRTKVSVHDLVMLYTDGLFEVENSAGEYYDQSGVIATVQKRISLPAPQLFDEMLDDVRSFSATRRFNDDVCLVGLEVERIGGFSERTNVKRHSTLETETTLS